LPIADQNGTERVFPANQDEIVDAITNAFADSRYRQMILEPASDVPGLVPGFKEKTGFVLESMSATGSITNIPLTSPGTTPVPYVAYFYIRTTQLGTNKSGVTVRTIRSEVIDGQEPGVHGGWANHYRKVPPVRQEEENVLAMITSALQKTQKNEPVPVHQ
jgi:hypothetical protein